MVHNSNGAHDSHGHQVHTVHGSCGTHGSQCKWFVMTDLDPPKFGPPGPDILKKYGPLGTNFTKIYGPP